MATYTTNYHLKKPAPSDTVDIDDLNGNFDVLDEHLKIAEDKTDLPDVTSADNGKVLRVVNGAWAAVNVEAAEGAMF